MIPSIIFGIVCFIAGILVCKWTYLESFARQMQKKLTEEELFEFDRMMDKIRF